MARRLTKKIVPRAERGSGAAGGDEVGPDPLGGHLQAAAGPAALERRVLPVAPPRWRCFAQLTHFADRARLLGRRDAVQCALSLAGAIVLFALWMAALGSLGTRQRSPIEHLLHTAKPTLGLD